MSEPSRDPRQPVNEGYFAWDCGSDSWRRGMPSYREDRREHFEALVNELKLSMMRVIALTQLYEEHEMLRVRGIRRMEEELVRVGNVEVNPEDLVCKVCFERACNTALSCGHIFCAACVAIMQRRCGFCRKKSQIGRRIFFC